MTEAEQGALFEEPPRVPPPDGPWTVTEDGWAYQLLGEDSETLMIDGHRIDDAGIQVVLLHAGQYWEDHWGVLPVQRAWAAELDRCPRHGWLPRWLRQDITVPVEWIRSWTLRVMWRLWWRHRPMRRRWRPDGLQRLQYWWDRFARCSFCEWVDHYRGESDASYWTWDTDDGPADANRGRRGYIPVTIVDLDV